MAKTEISPGLTATYKKAHYQVIIEEKAITLRIDRYSASIERLLAKSNQPCAALITAFNPLGQKKNQQDNQAINTQLREVLTQHTNLIFDSVNIDPTKQWPDEQSFLTLGVDLKTIKSIGKQFAQNAVVWSASDAIPRLILLR